MANSYCTLDQLNAFIDRRVLTPVANDGDGINQSETRQQLILDLQASWMESNLAGWYAFPIVDSTTGAAPLVCTRYVALTALVPLLGRRLAEFPALAHMVAGAEKWLESVGKYQAGIPNVTRLATAHPALVSSDNMTGAPDTEYLPWMTRNEFVVRPPGTSGSDYLGNGTYTGSGDGSYGGIGQ
jgi:hypothetical protein